MTTYQAWETPNLPINYFKYPLIDSSNSIDDGKQIPAAIVRLTSKLQFKLLISVAVTSTTFIAFHIADEVDPVTVCPTCQAPFKRSEMKFPQKTGAAMACERAEKQGNRMAAVDPRPKAFWSLSISTSTRIP